VVGTAAAQAGGHVIWWRAVVALVVSLALQVGTNYANDYSDGIRGTDDARVGPVRLVASGLKSPKKVRGAALASFAVAGLAGLVLAAVAGWWLVAVGVASIAAGWFYTGGPRPYGYAGLGELFVFVFFGLVATAGTTYVQLGQLTAVSALAGAAVGFLAVALLVINNLRDIPGDNLSGKRTLAVRVGAPATRRLYTVCLALPFLLACGLAAYRLGALLALVAIPIAMPPAQKVRAGAVGRDLIPVLGETGRTQLAFGLMLAAGLWI
jgi:1,4-dihydroxy-2-naphthoate octaprenyltransferase